MLTITSVKIQANGTLELTTDTGREITVSPRIPLNEDPAIPNIVEFYAPQPVDGMCAVSLLASTLGNHVADMVDRIALLEQRTQKMVEVLNTIATLTRPKEPVVVVQPSELCLRTQAE